MNEENFSKIFDYVFTQSYKKIDDILKNEKVAETLTKKNNNYYRNLCILNPRMEKKIIKSYCFSIIYMLILTATFEITKNDIECENDLNNY